MKPVTGLSTFANQAPPWSLTQLDADIAALQAAINDFNSYSNPMSDTSGVANAITVTTPANITASYTAGLTIWVKVANTTTATAVTVNLNALGLKNVVIPGFSALIIGQLLAGGVYELFYDGTNFQVIGAVQAVNSGSGLFLVSLLVGGNSQSTFNFDGGGVIPAAQSNATSSSVGWGTARYSNDGSPSQLMMGKSRGATLGAQTIVQSNDELGAIYFTGSDGASLQTAAGIIASVDTVAPGVGSMPGALYFRTTPIGAVVSQNRLSIASTGSVGIAAPTSGVTALNVNGATGAVAQFINCGNNASGVGLSVQGTFTGAGNVSLVQLSDLNNTNGVNLKMIGNGGVTASKTLRVIAGVFEITNDAFNQNILAIQDNGNTTIGGTSGNLSTTGGIQVSGPTGGVLGNGTVNVSSGFFINGVNVAASGTFTGTLTGFTTTVTGTVNYRITNGVVFLWLASTLQGTSNAASMTLTGAPAAIQPSVLRQVPCSGLQDNSSAAFTLFAYASIATNGVITFTYPGGTPIGSTLTNPTNAGLKGVSTSTLIVYPL